MPFRTENDFEWEHRVPADADRRWRFDPRDQNSATPRRFDNYLTGARRNIPLNPDPAFARQHPDRWEIDPGFVQDGVRGRNVVDHGFSQRAYAGPMNLYSRDMPSLGNEAPGRPQMIPVGNPANPGLRSDWERANGRRWPRTPDGRSYDVAHKRAIADGGTNTLDNIEPMHPDGHKAKHRNDGDSGRWGRRSSIARAFGGRVEPPNPGGKVRGFGGPLNPLDILGILSGRIRTDTFPNFMSDVIGVPSPDDMRFERQRMERQRLLYPDCPPGSDCV